MVVVVRGAAPTFEWDKDAGRGQRVIDHWAPESYAGQCQEGGDRPQTVQQHGRPISSSKHSVFLCLCRDKKKHMSGDFLNSTLPRKKTHSANTSLFLFINLCDTSNKWLPGAPSRRVLATQHRGVEITPRSGFLRETDESWWRGAKALKDVCTLGKNYLRFSECDKLMERSRRL